jgi:hypothetical protein
MKLHALAIGGLLACSAPAYAIKIEIRYDYDTNGFFNQPGSKEALRKAADLFETLIHDSLLSINPATDGGGTWIAKPKHPSTGVVIDIPNLVVPADTIIVFAGSRELGGPIGNGGFGGFSSNGDAAWHARVRARGQVGALATTIPKTDFAPWGGHITFESGVDWNFSTDFPESEGFPFISIALHEFGHLFGIGTCDSWNAKISEGEFTGPFSVQAFGGNVPLAGTGHWRNDAECTGPDGHDPDNPLNILSKAFGSFNAAHGYSQIALMDPSLCNAGPFFKVFTDLDIAALRDIGWEIDPPARWITAVYSPTEPFSFSWPSTTGFTYRVQTTTTPGGAWSTLNTQPGTGSIQSYTAPAPGGTRTFFRLNTNPPAAGPLPLMAAGAAVDPGAGGESGEDHADGQEATDCHSGPSHNCP